MYAFKLCTTLFVKLLICMFLYTLSHALVCRRLFKITLLSSSQFLKFNLKE